MSSAATAISFYLEGIVTVTITIDIDDPDPVIPKRAVATIASTATNRVASNGNTPAGRHRPPGTPSSTITGGAPSTRCRTPTSKHRSVAPCPTRARPAPPDYVATPAALSRGDPRHIDGILPTCIAIDMKERA